MENLSRSQCLVMQREFFDACQTASLCPFVWMVFSCCFGGDGALACDFRSGDIYPYPSMKQSATFMVLGAGSSSVSHSPCLHQGEDEVRPDQLFEFQVLYNAVLCNCAQYTLP